jgi:hypothetical protein
MPSMSGQLTTLPARRGFVTYIRTRHATGRAPPVLAPPVFGTPRRISAPAEPGLLPRSSSRLTTTCARFYPGLSLLEILLWYLMACEAKETFGVVGCARPQLPLVDPYGPVWARVTPSGPIWAALIFLTSYSLCKLGVTPGHPMSLRKSQAGLRATVTRRSDAAMAAAAAPGSGALVIGRPITSRSAPASTASSGVATRA